MLSGFDTGVGHQQDGFEFFVKGVVNLSAGKHSRQTSAGFLSPAFSLPNQVCRLASAIGSGLVLESASTFESSA